MNDLVGLVRRGVGDEDRAGRAGQAAGRATQVSAAGGWVYNPGWRLALDLRNMLWWRSGWRALERRITQQQHHDYPRHVAGVAQDQPDLLGYCG